MASTFQRFKHFLSLPTALILFLSASIGYFVVIDWINVIDVLDETTGYSYGYGYGYDCFTDWNKFIEQYVTKCKDKLEDYKYDYGYGYNPDTIKTVKSERGGYYIPPQENDDTIKTTEASKELLKQLFPLGLTDLQKAGVLGSPFSTEINLAYLYARAMGVTTIDDINAAQPEQGTTRAQLAKMLVQWADKALTIDIDPTREAACSSYGDIKDDLGDLKDFIIQACQAKIMGLQVDETTPLLNFSPDKFVSRGEFLTVLGRLIWDGKYKDMEPYYAGYMQAFYDAGLIKVNDPTLLDIRSNIWIILQRTHLWLMKQ